MKRESIEGLGGAWLAVALGVVLMVAVLPIAGSLLAKDSELYYRALQEDGTIEWMTVWTFLAATALFTLAAVRRRKLGRIPWFYLAVAAFCFFVAMEEISWGQRLLGYRPPSYFLRENFQQELNIHNVVHKSLRKLSVKVVLLGYGLVLPVLASVPILRRWLQKLDIEAPPLGLAPGFLVAFYWYDEYPWKFSGELVELIMGFGFMLAAFAAWRRPGAANPLQPIGLRPVAPWLAVSAALLAASAGMAMVSQARLGSDPELEQAARFETQALVDDLKEWSRRRGGRSATRCGQHMRVFTFVEKHRRQELLRGRFAALTDQGMPEERAAYFIDPWNTAYWLRHECDDDRVLIVVYSFGPNRRRNSTDWELLEDDLGAFLKRPRE